MFGYVNADKPNMLMKDYATYRAYYCGLCKTIGKRNTPMTRLTVNYDITFLTMLAHNYLKVEPKINEERCFIHPIGKKFAVVENDEVQEVVADINIILGYYKAYDDVIDGRSLKHKIAQLFLKGKYKRIAKKYPELDSAVKKSYDTLRGLELSGSRDLGAVLQTSGDMLVAVGKTACKSDDVNLIELCDALGKWVYLIDAYDDIREDEQKKRYNPLIPENGLNEENMNAITNMVENNLYSYIRTIRECYDRMDITITEGALSNVVYCGLRARTESVIKKRGIKCVKTLL